MMVPALATAEAPVSTNSRTEPLLEALDLRQIYAEHFRGVWRNLHRLGVPDSALDDAVQDVFLVVHRRRSEFAGRSSLRTWIFGIVLHVAKDYRRAARRHAMRVQRYTDAVVHGAERSEPSEDAERREANRLLHLYGIHFCLGSHLARLEGRIALEEVLERFPSWEVDWDNAVRAHTSTVRGWESLPVSAG